MVLRTAHSADWQRPRDVVFGEAGDAGRPVAGFWKK